MLLDSLVGDEEDTKTQADRTRDRLHGNTRCGLVAKRVAATPDRLNKLLPTRRFGELPPKLADEYVDDLHFGLVHAPIQMTEKTSLS